MQVVPQADRVLIRLEELSDVCYILIKKPNLFLHGVLFILILIVYQFQNIGYSPICFLKSWKFGIANIYYYCPYLKVMLNVGLVCGPSLFG